MYQLLHHPKKNKKYNKENMTLSKINFPFLIVQEKKSYINIKIDHQITIKYSHINIKIDYQITIKLVNTEMIYIFAIRDLNETALINIILV